MNGQTFTLAVVGLLACAAGVSVFRTRSMVRSASALLTSMAAIGAMFLAMQAEFLGVLQLMMMASEMTIMALFMVRFMMDPGGLAVMEMTHQKRVSAVIGVVGALAALGITAFNNWGPAPRTADTPAHQVANLGFELMGRSMLIFETAGITILVAMVAATAVAIARRP